MAILGALLGANSKAASYSAAGKAANNQGLRQRTQKYSEANAARLQAMAELASAARNMETAQANKTYAMAEARAAQGITGLQSDGRQESRVAKVADKSIANMSRAASDQAAALYGQASTARNAGDSAMRLGERTQSIYSKMAAKTKMAGWLEAGLDTAFSLAGAVSGYMGAQSYNENAAAFNDANGLTAGMAGFREAVNPWGQAFSSAMEHSDGVNSLASLIGGRQNSNASSAKNVFSSFFK